MTKERWFQAGSRTGWSKRDSADKRRRTVRRSRGGDLLASGRALLALSNVTQDKTTKKLARQDADYFFRQHRKKQK